MVTEIVSANGREWPVVELLQAMLDQGWETQSAEPINTVRTAISRLVKRGVLQRTGVGTYRRAGEQLETASPPLMSGDNGTVQQPEMATS
jgi:DNA-binding transcriptional regulator PaaX